MKIQIPISFMRHEFIFMLIDFAVSAETDKEILHFV